MLVGLGSNYISLIVVRASKLLLGVDIGDFVESKISALCRARLHDRSNSLSGVFVKPGVAAGVRGEVRVSTPGVIVRLERAIPDSFSATFSSCKTLTSISS